MGFIMYFFVELEIEEEEPYVTASKLIKDKGQDAVTGSSSTTV
mgnify:CR=1 FL=1